MATEPLMEMSEDKQKTVEDDEDDVISEAIGEFGKWQLMLTFLLSLVNIPCTWHIFVPTFHAAERDTWCARPDIFRNVPPDRWKNCTQPEFGDICTVYKATLYNLSRPDLCVREASLQLFKCTAWEFAGSGQTIISEFNLVCDKKSLNNLAEMVFLAGVAAGGLVSGIISDKYGRKKTLIASLLIQSTLGTAIAFVPWFSMYAILRTALGFISVSVVFSGFVLAIEVVGGHWRTISGISYIFPVSVGYATIAGIAWLVRDWRQLQLAVSLPGFLFLGLWWVIPESPRWLLALGRTKEVLAILQTAARFNNKKLPANLDKKLLPSSLEEDQSEDVGVMDLFKTAQMRRKTFLLFLLWFSVYLIYYGLVLNLGNIGGNLYINSVLIGVVEVPALAISILFLVKGGRRWTLFATLIVAGMGAFLAVPIQLAAPHLQWLITTFTMISKFTISSSNAIMPVFTAELYPTTIRNIGVGAANVSAGIALMLVPYLWDLVSIHPSIPMSMLGIFGVLGGLAVLGLPETGCGPLVETLKEEKQVTRLSIDVGTSETKRINNNCCT